MDLQRLWAPWRIGYISGQESTDPAPEPATWHAGADHDCFLCRASATYVDQGEADRANLVVARDAQVLVVLNRYPYNNGHLLVAPLRHVAELNELTDDEHLAAIRRLVEMTEMLSQRLQAGGFNIGLNLGQLAGAGVPGHLHWHIVPRWPGDTNFMPVVSDTHVISQSLDELWDMLTDARGDD